MELQTVLYEVADGIAVVTLNRPEVHNAFDPEMSVQLIKALRKLDADPKVRAVVLMGAGKSFSAGADIEHMKKSARFTKAQNLQAALESAQNNYNQNFSDYTVIDSQASSGTIAKKFMANVFMWMFVALGVSAFMAYLYATNQSLLSDLYTISDGVMRPSMLGWIVTFAPIGLVLLMNFGYSKLSASALTLLFLFYAAI